MDQKVDNHILLDSKKEEIDINLIFQTFYRRKIIIFLIAFLSTTYSLFVALISNRTYQGEFQVALKTSNQATQLPNIISVIGGSIGGLKSDSSGYALKTQIKILQSPSVLMDIFKFVENSKKRELNDNYFLKYKIWEKEQLKISLEGDTSILNIAYKDSNKELILPVLKKLSKKYREFNGVESDNKLFKTQNFLKNQISLYEKKNLNSIRNIQDFASIHDLSPLLGSINSDQNAFLTSNESKSIQISNNLKLIQEKLQLFNSPSFDPNQILDFAREDQAFTNKNNSLLQLKNIENKLISSKLFYKDNDPSIISKKRIKEILYKTVIDDYKKFLKIREKDLSIQIKSLQRPKEVLIEYKRLIEETSRNSRALQNLENQLLNVSIKKAKGYEPYELVTEPVLLPYPVGPKRKINIMLGLLYGLIGGCLAALIFDRYKNLVYSVEQIKLMTGLPLIGNLDYKDFDLWDRYLKLISKKLKNFSEKNVSIYYSGEVNPAILPKIESFLKKEFPDFNFKSTLNYKDALVNPNIILFFPLGTSKVENIKLILKDISTLDIKTNGFIVIK